MSAKERERLRALVKQWRDYAKSIHAEIVQPFDYSNVGRLGKIKGMEQCARDLEEVLNKP